MDNLIKLTIEEIQSDIDGRFWGIMREKISQLVAQAESHLRNCLLEEVVAYRWRIRTAEEILRYPDEIIKDLKQKGNSAL